MLVPSMTTEEILREIKLDYDVVKRKTEYLSNDIRKRSIKTKKTIIKSVTYTSPRKNNWVFVFEVNKKITYTSMYVYTNHDGFRAYGCVGNVEDGLILITKHFLDRYNERFLKKPNLTKVDILTTFLERNTDMNLIMRLGGEHSIFSIVNDGVALGNNTTCGKNNIRVIKTFITKNMLFESQEKEYNDIKSKFIESNPTPTQNTNCKSMDELIKELQEKEKATNS